LFRGERLHHGVDGVELKATKKFKSNIKKKFLKKLETCLPRFSQAYLVFTSLPRFHKVTLFDTSLIQLFLIAENHDSPIPLIKFHLKKKIGLLCKVWLIPSA